MISNVWQIFPQNWKYWYFVQTFTHLGIIRHQNESNLFEGRGGLDTCERSFHGDANTYEHRGEGGSRLVQKVRTFFVNKPLSVFSYYTHSLYLVWAYLTPRSQFWTLIRITCSILSTLCIILYKLLINFSDEY